MSIRAKITSKGQITIPQAIRKYLRLTPGQELEFDEQAPFLKAVKVVDKKRMRSALGCLKGRLKESSQELLEQLRGDVSLP